MRVYCIDDDPVILGWLVTNVEWECYNCQVVGNSTRPKEALSYLKGEPVDLLITDISMPQMSGLELIKAAKEVNPDIMVIIISAFGEFQYVKEALKFGVINYLLKPIDTMELYDCLKIAVSIHERQRKDVHQHGDISFRNSVLQQLIAGGCDEEQFADKCALAGILLEDQIYSVMVANADDKAMERVKTWVKRTLPQGLLVCYCFVDANNYLVILSIGNREGMDQLRQKIQEFVETEQSDLFLCVGKTLEKYRMIAESYQACCDFVNARVLFGGRAVKQEDYPYESYQGAWKGEKLRQFLDALQAREYAGIVQSIQKLVEGYSSQERRKAIICLGIFMIRNIRQQHPSMESIMPGCPLEEQNTTAKMLDWLTCFYLDMVRNEKEKEDSKHSYVSMVIREVKEHYSDTGLSLQTLAERCGLTTAYLGKLFCDETGEFFRDFLLRIRLHAAEELLLKNGRNIGEISREVGFSSQSYFNKVFLKYYKMSPMEYRIRLRSREKQ